MDSVELDLQARARDLGGGFTVRRVLPAPQRRMIGPFIFFDHMGPVKMAAGDGLDVRPHPHIGLATVTYLFEGEFLHRDSLGSEQIIQPGAVNWMTAGKGIVHSERSPLAARKTGPMLHGLQLWVALPTDHEETEPSFFHHAASDIPEVDRAGARLKIVAGSAYGATSPVRVMSELFYIDANLEAGASLDLPPGQERALYVALGKVTVEGAGYGDGSMVLFKTGAPARVTAVGPARLMLLGGAPVGPRHIDWNFVSSSPDRIQRARTDWQSRSFPTIPNDNSDFIPLP